MLALERLLQTKARAPSSVEGRWQVVRLCLDPATGEQLNVGVRFVDEASGESTQRLLHNVAGLRCLYNDDMAEDAAFLIDQAEQALEQGIMLPADWNISLGQPLFVRGSSAQSIIDELFARMVPLGARENAESRLDSDDHLHATRNVRKTVRTLLAKHLQLGKKTPEFWHNQPVETEHKGHKVRLDVQIEAPGQVASRLHGTIASAWYKSKYHRHAYLDKGATTMSTAAQLYPKDLNVMYLLYPGANDGFSKEELQVIESDVNSIRWVVEQQGAKLAAFSSERRMTENILEDLGVI